MNLYHCPGWHHAPVATAVYNIISPLRPWRVHTLWPCDPHAFFAPADWLLIDKLNCLIHKKWCSTTWRWNITNGGLSIVTDVSFFTFFQIHIFPIGSTISALQRTRIYSGDPGHFKGLDGHKTHPEFLSMKSCVNGWIYLVVGWGEIT